MPYAGPRVCPTSRNARTKTSSKYPGLRSTTLRWSTVEYAGGAKWEADSTAAQWKQRTTRPDGGAASDDRCGTAVWRLLLSGLPATPARTCAGTDLPSVR